jgi:hypothetical protein
MTVGLVGHLMITTAGFSSASTSSIVTASAVVIWAVAAQLLCSLGSPVVVSEVSGPVGVGAPAGPLLALGGW